MIGLSLLAIIVGAVAPKEIAVEGYSHYSHAPLMGYGSDALKSVVSHAIFTENAWVTDKDEWTRTSDNAIVQLANGATAVVSTIASGTLLSTAIVFDEVTAKNSYTYVINAPSVAPNTTEIFIDVFHGVDLQTDNVLHDVDTPNTQCTVVVTGPASNGGGGGS